MLFTASYLPKIKIGEFQPRSLGCLRREDLPRNTCKDAFSPIVRVDISSSTGSNVASPLKSIIEDSLDYKSAKTASEILLDNKGESRDDTSDSLVNDCKIYKKKGCRIINGKELLRAWKLGNVMILHSNESMILTIMIIKACAPISELVQ